MGYPMVEGYPLVFTRDNYFYWNKLENIFLGGKGGPHPPVSARSTKKGERVLSPPYIWSHDRQQSRNGARWRKTAQNGAKRRKTARNTAKRRKTAQDGAREEGSESVPFRGRHKTAQDGAKRRKTAQDDAKRRKTAQNGAKRRKTRKTRKTAQNRRYLRGTKLGGANPSPPF